MKQNEVTIENAQDELQAAIEWVKMGDDMTVQNFLDCVSKELIDILKKHERTGTLLDGKNLFLLHTGGVSYKIIIERVGRFVEEK